jgi:hypothetical protein
MDINTSISLVNEYRAIDGHATPQGTKKYMENAIKKMMRI